jgi:hypothetical protein
MLVAFIPSSCTIAQHSNLIVPSLRIIFFRFDL